MAKSPKILITGFGPFPGVDENPSARFAIALAKVAARRFDHVDLVAQVLATQWSAAPAALLQLYKTNSPDIVLHFGVSASARGFTLEQVANNVCDTREDSCGHVPEHRCVVPGAPAMLQSTFPATAIATRLTARAIPVKLSQNAGAYLCNAILYRSLLALTQGPATADTRTTLVGFIHLPEDLGTQHSPLSWRTALSAGMDIIDLCCTTWKAQ